MRHLWGYIDDSNSLRSSTQSQSFLRLDRCSMHSSYIEFSFVSCFLYFMIIGIEMFKIWGFLTPQWPFYCNARWNHPHCEIKGSMYFKTLLQFAELNHDGYSTEVQQPGCQQANKFSEPCTNRVRQITNFFDLLLGHNKCGSLRYSEHKSNFVFT